MFKVDAVKAGSATPGKEVHLLIILGEGNLAGYAVRQDLVQSERLGHEHTGLGPRALFGWHVACCGAPLYTSHHFTSPLAARSESYVDKSMLQIEVLVAGDHSMYNFIYPHDLNLIL